MTTDRKNDNIKIVPAYDPGINNSDLEAAIRRIDNEPTIKKWNNPYSFPTSSTPYYRFPNSSTPGNITYHTTEIIGKRNGVGVFGVIVIVLLMLIAFGLA